MKAFREVQKLLTKNHGKSVADVMTPSPLCVRKMTNLEDAARFYSKFLASKLTKKILFWFSVLSDQVVT